MRRVRLLVAVVAVALTSTACQLSVQVGVDVREDGSGTVRVAVGLDDDTLAKIGGAANLRSVVEVDDLVAAGWTVSGPSEPHDGYTWLEATKPFASAAQATRILGEIGGDTFAGFRLERTRSFARTTFLFEGTVDLRRGLESFSDPELTAALDGKPLGQDVAAIEQQFGGPIDDLVHIDVAVQLPGKVSSNAEGLAADGVVWQPKLSDPTPAMLHASSRAWRPATIVWTVVAVVAALALALFIVLSLVRYMRLSRGRKYRGNGRPAAG